MPPVDYAKLAAQHGGKAAAAPAAAPPVDYAALARESGGAPAQASEPKTFGGLLSNAVTDIGNQVSGVIDMVRDLPGTARAMLEQKAQWEREARAAATPEAQRAFIENLKATGPKALVAEFLSEFADRVYQEPVTAVTSALALNKALTGGARPPAVPPKPPAAPAPADPVTAFAQQRGIPMSVGQATGNPVARAVEQLNEKTAIGGSAITRRARDTQQTALTRVGNELADAVSPAPATAEQAGDAVTAALRARGTQLNAEAGRAYDRLRQIEGSDAAARQVELPATQAANVVMPRFTASTMDDLFDEAWADARRQGFTGAKDDLRAAFSSRLDDAMGLQAEAAEAAAQYSPKALLQAVAKVGGIGDDAGFAGEIQQLWEQSSGYVAGRNRMTQTGAMAKGRTLATGGFAGVPGVLRKKGGLPLDTVAELIRQDERFAHIRTPNDLLDAIEAARVGKIADGPSLTSALEAVGVKPGAKWWEAGDDISFEPAALEAPAQATRQVTMQAPVDLRATKAVMRPTLQALLRKKELAGTLMGDEARMADRLGALMDAPDFAPLSTADGVLSDLKSLSRVDDAFRRTVGQGVAAEAVRNLDRAVVQTARDMGPEAFDALMAGRAATVNKFKTIGVLDSLPVQEPVRVFRKLTSDRDTTINLLRQVQREAPAELPKIGRAYLEGLLQTATAEGGFARADGLFAQWQRLGPDTKAMLFREHVGDIDKFLQFAKRAGQNVNPSGSAFVGTLSAKGTFTVLNPATGIPLELGQAALAKAMWSPTIVRLLTRSMVTPRQAVSAASSLSAQLARALARANLIAQPTPAAAVAQAPATSGADQ